MLQQPLTGQGLHIIEDSRSYSDTPHSVGLLWASDKPDAGTSTDNTQRSKQIRHPRSRWIRTWNPSKRAFTVLRQYRLEGAAFVRYIFELFIIVTGPKMEYLLHNREISMSQNVNRVIMSWFNHDTVSNHTSRLADASSVSSEMIFVPWSLYLQHVIVSCSYRSFNTQSYGSHSSNSPYKNALLDTLWGFVLRYWSPKTWCHLVDCCWDLCL
jgi:hypothetical protein